MKFELLDSELKILIYTINDEIIDISSYSSGVYFIKI